MKVTMITGSYPPETCGVGDYTSQLVAALIKKGTLVEVFHKADWRVRNIKDPIQAIKTIGSDVVHIQYPTAGFGKRLGPQVLSLAVPSVITIHEATRAHILRKLSLYPFSARSRHVVFTTPYEKNFCARWAPWISGRSSVIPVGSSITVTSQGSERDPDEIVYFGLFRPNKGLEDVLSLASLIKQKKLNFRIHMIGKPYPEGSAYSGELYARSVDLPVKWTVGLPEEAVGPLLARSSYAYMPFPDGVSGRRTSLMALLAHGVATVTTRGAHTPESIEESVLFADDPEHALRLIVQLSKSKDQKDFLMTKAGEYADSFSWDSIAARHIQLYENLLRKSSDQA